MQSALTTWLIKNGRRTSTGRGYRKPEINWSKGKKVMLVWMQKNNSQFREKFQVFMNRSPKNEVEKWSISRVKKCRLLIERTKLCTSVCWIVSHDAHNWAFFFLPGPFCQRSWKFTVWMNFPVKMCVMSCAVVKKWLLEWRWNGKSPDESPEKNSQSNASFYNSAIKQCFCIHGRF